VAREGVERDLASSCKILLLLLLLCLSPVVFNWHCFKYHLLPGSAAGAACLDDMVGDWC